MALDKQKILNELGSVVNQLQSADCGCEPCTGVQRCMGFCNPPKLYADTYNYLNHNMMQPAVREVYSDLKSINPGNTIMNNPMGAQMGLSPPNPNQGNRPPQNSMPGNQNAMMPAMGHAHMPHTCFGNAGMNNPNLAHMNHPNHQQGMGQMGQEMGHVDPGMGQDGRGMGQPGKEMAHTGHMGHEMGHEMGQGMGYMGHGMAHPGQGMGNMHQGMAHSGGMLGMGPQIANMMGNARTNNMPNRGGPPPDATGDMPPSDMGQMAPNMHGDANPGHYHPGHMQNNAGFMEMNNMVHADPRMQPNQHMAQPSGYPATNPNTPGHAMPGNTNRMNPPSNQMGNMNANPQVPTPNQYGQHSAGMAKFNQMFPGVMKGDLGFDPMAIAIQMNPANQQRNAMDTMQKMLMNNSNAAGINKIMDSSGNASSVMQPVINATNAAAASIAQPNQHLINQPPSQQNVPQHLGSTPMQNNQMPQQVYTTLTEAPAMDQQQVPQQQLSPSEQWQQQQPPPDQAQRLEAVPSNSLPTVYEGAGDPNARTPQPSGPERMYREPILPADTSRNLLHSHHFKPQRFFEFNTLGQPVEMTPVRHPVQLPNQPQTLSPQPPPTRFGIKNTASKTALMGNRPIGKTPSRSQLQQVYNQYKGSHSYTQQNIRPSARNGSFSEGHINVPQSNMPPQTSLENIERHGGDTAANNQMRQMGQVDDVPAGKKLPDDYGMAPMRNARLRNGLQDQVYTAYPTSAKWSFHGSTPAPFSPGYRIKNK